MAISIEFKPIYYDILQMLAINYRNETIYHVYTLNFLCRISLKIKMPLSDLIKKHEIGEYVVNS